MQALQKLIEKTIVNQFPRCPKKRLDQPMIFTLYQVKKRRTLPSIQDKKKQQEIYINPLSLKILAKLLSLLTYILTYLSSCINMKWSKCICSQLKQQDEDNNCSYSEEKTKGVKKLHDGYN